MTFSIPAHNIVTFIITTISITSLSITTFNIIALSITTFSITTLSIMTFNITALSKMTFSITLTNRNTQHNDAQYMYIEYCYSECPLWWLSFMLSVTNYPFILSVIMLNFVAPCWSRDTKYNGTQLYDTWRLSWVSQVRVVVPCTVVLVCFVLFTLLFYFNGLAYFHAYLYHLVI
jgi:hypothetical protein